MNDAGPGAVDGTSPLFSIVIPTYNGRSVLETCLASVHRNLPTGGDCSAEVIVADDASSDGTSDWLREHHPAVRLVRLDRNGGFCASRIRRGRFFQSIRTNFILITLAQTWAWDRYAIACAHGIHDSQTPQ
jgi:glycosyltransferase involved in cell wall biosynthesis